MNAVIPPLLRSAQLKPDVIISSADSDVDIDDDDDRWFFLFGLFQIMGFMISNFHLHDFVILVYKDALFFCAFACYIDLNSFLWLTCLTAYVVLYYLYRYR